MNPSLTGIDHVHVYVADRAAAEMWYADVLGFTRVEALMSWATPDGPLTIENPDGTVHLALFERSAEANTTAIAFGASGAQFLRWKQHLEERGLKLRVTDHTLAYSLYFHDPWNNMHEITTYDHEQVATALTA